MYMHVQVCIIVHVIYMCAHVHVLACCTVIWENTVNRILIFSSIYMCMFNWHVYGKIFFQAIEKPLQMKFVLRPMSLWTKPLQLLLTSLDFTLGIILSEEEGNDVFWSQLGAVVEGYLFVQP